MVGDIRNVAEGIHGHEIEIDGFGALLLFLD